MRILSYILLIIIILLGITFALINHNPVTVNYYLGEVSLPLSFVLVFAFVSGCLLGLIVGLSILIKLKLKNYRLQQQLKVTEKEVENLRAIPLQDRH
jgi:lipopolysaccharide assembly protein A